MNHSRYILPKCISAEIMLTTTTIAICIDFYLPVFLLWNQVLDPSIIL